MKIVSMNEWAALSKSVPTAYGEAPSTDWQGCTPVFNHPVCPQCRGTLYDVTHKVVMKLSSPEIRQCKNCSCTYSWIRTK